MGDGGIGTLAARVQAWIDVDPDPTTRAEAADLLARAEAGDAAAEAELRDAFDGRLRFGTAGLRAALGAGPRRMNRVVVAQSSAGLAAYLHERAAADDSSGSASAPPSVVVGFDGRVNSAVFARDAAEVFAGAGLSVTLLPEALPTPLTAFAVRHLSASAGVMITASHNPPGDNGYKVYLGGADGGAQIVPPQDREIAACIERCLEAVGPVPPRSERIACAGPEIVDAYVAATAAALGSGSDTPNGDATGGNDPVVVYTAMHGVGAPVARRVFAAAGLPAVIPVAAQDEPDGSFPTVEYPNPEESESLHLAFELARAEHADFVIAHDPDADRVALAARCPDTPGGYRRLTGNELGLLLGWRAAEREHAAAARAGRTPHGTLVNTIVSSPALGAVAQAYGLSHVETLAGFKWVARVPDLLFGFEEALGYLIDPEVVGDKDGISAAADALALGRELHAAGRSVWELLDEASERFGHFASTQVVVRCDHGSAVEALAAWVRAHPPTAFGSLPVSRVRDFRTPGLAPVRANVLAYDLADGSRVMIRPSGTEPKLKVYIDAFSDVGAAAERSSATAHALTEIETAVRAYLDLAHASTRTALDAGTRAGS